MIDYNITLILDYDAENLNIRGEYIPPGHRLLVLNRDMDVYIYTPGDKEVIDGGEDMVDAVVELTKPGISISGWRIAHPTVPIHWQTDFALVLEDVYPLIAETTDDYPRLYVPPGKEVMWVEQAKAVLYKQQAEAAEHLGHLQRLYEHQRNCPSNTCTQS